MPRIETQEARLVGKLQPQANLTGRVHPSANLKGSLCLPEVIYVGESDKTYILVDDDGNEAVAIFTEDTVTLDATPNDIRIGKTAATVKGVTMGEKEIPSFHTSEGQSVVPPGRAMRFRVPLNYEYTKLQVLICAFNTTISNSVATNKVGIDNSVYPVNSADSIAAITVDHAKESIDLGLMNDGESLLIIRYFTYKEIY